MNHSPVAVPPRILDHPARTRHITQATNLRGYAHSPSPPQLLHIPHPQSHRQSHPRPQLSTLNPTSPHHQLQNTPHLKPSIQPATMPPQLPPTLRIHHSPPDSTNPKHRSLHATVPFPAGSTIATFPAPLLALPDGATMRTTCNHCLLPQSQSPAPLKACTACRAAVYCGAACQRAHWRAAHKGECGMFRRVREEVGKEWLPTAVRAVAQVMVALLRGGSPLMAEAFAGEGEEGRGEWVLEGNVEGFKREEGVWRDMELQATAAVVYAGLLGQGEGVVERAREVLCKVSFSFSSTFLLVPFFHIFFFSFLLGFFLFSSSLFLFLLLFSCSLLLYPLEIESGGWEKRELGWKKGLTGADPNQCVQSAGCGHGHGGHLFGCWTGDGQPFVCTERVHRVRQADGRVESRAAHRGGR